MDFPFIFFFGHANHEFQKQALKKIATLESSHPNIPWLLFIINDDKYHELHNYLIDLPNFEKFKRLYDEVYLPNKAFIHLLYMPTAIRIHFRHDKNVQEALEDIKVNHKSIFVLIENFKQDLAEHINRDMDTHDINAFVQNFIRSLTKTGLKNLLHLKYNLQIMAAPTPNRTDATILINQDIKS